MVKSIYWLMTAVLAVSIFVLKDSAFHGLQVLKNTLSRHSTWTGLSVPNNANPPIFVIAYPGYAHVEKFAVITEGLVARGHSVTFITGRNFQSAAEKLGVKFQPLSWSEDKFTPRMKDQFSKLTDPGARSRFIIKKSFLGRMGTHHAELQTIFSQYQERYGKHAPVVVYDEFFAGILPSILGAPGIRPKTIAIGHTPLCVSSKDTFPHNSAKQPDTSDNSHDIHQKAQLESDASPHFTEINDFYHDALDLAGATRFPDRYYDGNVVVSDRFLQLTVPEFEYKRSDIRPDLDFIGALPSVGLHGRELPEWWDEILAAHAQGKRIIVATSSTVDTNVQNAILPALEALKDWEDTLVIATLVHFRPEDMNMEFPANSRVARFIPMDQLLPYATVVLTNAGSGTVQQALRNSVPVIVVGVGQDKPQVGGLVEYTGVGIYFRKPAIAPKEISEAVTKLLTLPAYRKNAGRIAEAFKKKNPLDLIDKTVRELIAAPETDL